MCQYRLPCIWNVLRMRIQQSPYTCATAKSMQSHAMPCDADEHMEKIYIVVSYASTVHQTTIITTNNSNSTTDSTNPTCRPISLIRRMSFSWCLEIGQHQQFLFNVFVIVFPICFVHLIVWTLHACHTHRYAPGLVVIVGFSVAYFQFIQFNNISCKFV